MSTENETAQLPFTKMPLTAPFPYFGGKRLVADMVWERFGDVENYVDPFCGSCAVPLGRPHPPRIETLNDADGMLVNALRGLRFCPEKVAMYADQPVWECDKHAIHGWLVQRKDSLPAKLEGDPDYVDARMAGYWIWGKCSTIGSEFCSGNGKWKNVDGQLLESENEGPGIHRAIPHLAGTGQGVNRLLGKDAVSNSTAILTWFKALSVRFRRTRIACGNWDRILGPSVTTGIGTTGVFFDPPYLDFDQWYREKTEGIAKDVEKWCVENGDNPKMRIALCGYEGQYQLPDTWECVPWKAQGGYGLQRKDGENNNHKRERIWFSKGCIKPELGLFSGL